jgi:membrane protein DedA with SNARE-associated domain
MEEMIRDWGYIVLFLYSLGGGFVALAIAGVLSYLGELNLYITLVVAFAANFTGDQVLFMLARNKNIFAKEMMEKHRRKIALATIMMRKQGDMSIFLQKYIYGIKTLIPIVIGLSKYDGSRFLFFNFLASILWVFVVGGSAYLLGEVVIAFFEEFKYYSIPIVFTILGGVYYLFKRVEKR